MLKNQCLKECSKEMFKFGLLLQEMFKRLVDAVPEVNLTPSCSPNYPSALKSAKSANPSHHYPQVKVQH